MSDQVSYPMCERIVERDAQITRLASGWCVVIEGRQFKGYSRSDAIRAAALDLQERLEEEMTA